MIKITMRLILTLFLFLFISFSVFAQTTGEDTGLPIPRFVSLQKDTVFARTGPGTRYPIKWVYKRENLPVEVIQEFDTWRKIRDIDGEEGWIHQSLLSGDRFAIFTEGQALPLLKEPKDDAQAVALIESNALLGLESCKESWCEAYAMGFKGFIHTDFIWGVYEGERIQ